MSSNWLSWFTTSPKDAERIETLTLLHRVRSLNKKSPFYDDEAVTRFIVDLVYEIFDEFGYTPSLPLGGALYGAIRRLLVADSFILEFPDDADLPSLTVEEGVGLRTTLRAQERFLSAHNRLLPIWRAKVVWLFKGMLGYFPPSAFTDVSEDGTAEDDSVVLPEARAYDLVDNLPEVIERIMGTLYDEDVTRAQVFGDMRERFELNLCTASGIRPDGPEVHISRVVTPTKSKLTEPSALVDTYLQGTPFQRFFYRALPFTIPFPARFEHTHIVGGTGHGKTQLMQFLIHHDLVRARDDGRAVVIIDSQGDLIRAVSQLSYFSPSHASGLSDRMVLVDPNDIEHPVCLNMFDFNRDRLSGYAPVDREKILNATIELYEYFFGALLGAELTQRQGLIFKYLARLLIEIPDATIHTLRELMEDGDKFRPHMEKLQGTARSFFATRFFDRQFNETKKQILTRLWGVLSNSSLERMFSHTKNKIDIFELLNEGKIIFINTAKDLLGQEGAAIFGRFFIALISQAAIQRAAMPPHERRPAFVYIDEAQDYFDDNISHLLNQARKYRVGLVFAHQNLDQLGAGLRASVLASTTIKFAGGLSAKDAAILDSEFRSDSAFLLNQKKARNQTEFACYVKNYTNKALSVSIPLGFVEDQPRLTAHDYAALVDLNRHLYSEPPMLPEDVPFPERGEQSESPRKARKPAPSVKRETETTPEQSQTQEPARHKYVEPESSEPSPQPKPKSRPQPKDIPQPGRGGRQHKYLQHLIKQLAEERGFRASIEESILDGAARVDVSLVRDATRIACQISVTTSKDWELGGIEKCLAAGYQEVVLVGGSERHVKAFEKFIEENLDEQHQGKVRYLTSETLIEYLNSLGVSPTKENVVRGYKVRTVQQPIDPEEAASRRKAISEVIARSLLNSKGAE